MHNDKPLVSVIVPVYQVEKFLDQCVKSIVCQTYSNLEIILVDDGSPDNSGKMIDLWAQKDKRIRPFHQPNQGLSSARNTGLDNCNGDWITFVDSDDYISSNYIEKMIENAMDTGSKLVISHYYELDEKEHHIDKIRINPSGIYKVDDFWRLYYSKQSNYVPLVVAWDKLYSKEIFSSLRYKAGTINEDEQILYSVIKNAQRISIIQDFLYYYRINRNGSIMQKINSISTIQQSKYEIYNYRTQQMIEDRKYSIASLNNLSSLSSLINEYTIFPTSENKAILSTGLKVIRSNYELLKSKGIRLKLKDILFIKMPYLISFLKRAKKRGKN